MAWIESHESLPSHPKTKRMCRLLKISPVIAVGHLHFLWWWAMNHAQDGCLDRYDADDIADACGWYGDVNLFYNALIDSGFIDESETGFIIHDWHDYAGKLIALRQKDADRKRNSRGKKDESEGSPADIQRTSDGHLEDSDGRRTESIRNPNPNLNQNLKPNKELKEYRPETIDLTRHLIFWMQRNNPNAKIPANLDKWNDEMDKLERLDNYDYMKIRSAIDWCQQDSFWKSNILSVSKLRDKIGTIIMQMQRKQTGGKVSSFSRLQQLAREEMEREASGNY